MNKYKPVLVCKENCLACVYSESSNIASVACRHPNPVRKNIDGSDYCYSYKFGDISDFEGHTE